MAPPPGVNYTSPPTPHGTPPIPTPSTPHSHLTQPYFGTASWLAPFYKVVVPVPDFHRALIHHGSNRYSKLCEAHPLQCSATAPLSRPTPCMPACLSACLRSPCKRLG